MAYRYKARSATPGDYNFVAGSLGFAPATADVKTTAHIGDGTAGTLNLTLYTLISGVVAAANVRNGVARYSGGSNGTAYIPAAAVVISPNNVDATTGTYVDPAEADVKKDVAYGVSPRHGEYDPMAAAVFPLAADVNVTDVGYGPTGAEYAGALDVAALEAAAAAAQLVTDQGVVLTAAASIKDNATILGQAGTYDFTAAIAAGHASGHADQLVTDTAAVEAAKAGMTTATTILGVTGTLNLTLYTLISGVVAAAYVIEGHDNYTGGSAGTYHEATVGEVQSGVHFGAGSVLIGTLAVTGVTMPDPASPILTSALDAIRTMLSALASVQTFLGVSTAATALERIHRDPLEGPETVEDEAAWWQAMRPFIVICADRTGDRVAARSAMGFGSGRAAIFLQQNYPADQTAAAAERDWRTTADQILSDLVNLQDLLLLQSGTIEDVGTGDTTENAALGEFQVAKLAIEWGWET